MNTVAASLFLVLFFITNGLTMGPKTRQHIIPHHYGATTDIESKGESFSGSSSISPTRDLSSDLFSQLDEIPTSPTEPRKEDLSEESDLSSPEEVHQLNLPLSSDISSMDQDSPDSMKNLEQSQLLKKEGELSIEGFDSAFFTRARLSKKLASNQTLLENSQKKTRTSPDFFHLAEIATSSSGSNRNLTPSHELRVTPSAQTPSRSPVSIPSKRLASRGINFYDSLHPIKAIPTIFSDTPVSTLAVTCFFNIDPKYAIPAWLLGNAVASVVASHYVIKTAEAHSPACARRLIKEILSPSEPLSHVWNPVYFAYYTTAWSIMGREKAVFNVTPFQAASFMILSGAIRQLIDLAINKRNPYSWSTTTSRIERRNPFSWNEENITAIAASPRSQTWRAFWEYLPDVIASSARSGSSNIPSYWQGTDTLQTITPKVKKSTAVYTSGLTSYYAVYRLMESLPLFRHKEASEMNQRMLKRLYHNIQRAAYYGIAAPAEFSSNLHTDSDETKNLLSRSATQTPPLTPTRTSTSTTPTRNLHKSSSSKKLIAFPLAKETLVASLKVLRSHLISYFKDPIFYRLENPWKEAPAPFKQAYSIIDLLDMYKAHVTTDQTSAEQIKEASLQLLDTLKKIRLTPQQVDTLILEKPQHSDLEKLSSSDFQSQEMPFLDILPLLHLFDRYTGTNPYKDKPHAVELAPLQGAANRSRGYGAMSTPNTQSAIHGENGYEAHRDDDLFSDDSDLDDGWAPR